MKNTELRATMSTRYMDNNGLRNKHRQHDGLNTQVKARWQDTGETNKAGTDQTDRNWWETQQ